MTTYRLWSKCRSDRQDRPSHFCNATSTQGIMPLTPPGASDVSGLMMTSGPIRPERPLAGPRSPHKRGETMDTLTPEKLAAALQEPDKALLARVLTMLGQERCAAILADTLTIESQGGMLTKAGDRRRRPGGV